MAIAGNPGPSVCTWKIYTSYYNKINPAVLLKKFAGEDGEKVDMQKLFGYIGLFSLVSLWWLGKTNLLTMMFQPLALASLIIRF